VAHALEDLIVVLDRTRDEHGRVGWLSRHFDWLLLLLDCFFLEWWWGCLGSELAALLLLLEGGGFDVVVGAAVTLDGEGSVQWDVSGCI
jgi:hypothetical protein